jgi:hypothetical protein
VGLKVRGSGTTDLPMVVSQGARKDKCGNKREIKKQACNKRASRKQLA